MSSKAGASQIPQLLRSSSVPSVVPRQGESDDSIVNKSIDVAEINAQPQDFVVVGGTKFRVTRSPRASSDSMSPVAAKSDEAWPTNGDEISDDPVLLRKALDNANEIITKQSKRIQQQAQIIEGLEREVKEGKEAVISAPSRDALSDDRVESSLPVSSSRFSARRRAEAKEIRERSIEGTPVSEYEVVVSEGSSNSNSTGAGRPSAIAIPYSSSPLKDSDADSTWNRLETLGAVTPTISPVGGATATPLPDTPGTTAAFTASATSAGDGEVITVGGSIGSASPTGPPKGLAARLAMGSQERRKLAAAKKTNAPGGGGGGSSSTGTPGSIPRPTQRLARIVTTPSIGTSSASFSTPTAARVAEPVFFWTEEKRRERKQFLFVAYDGEQLKATIASRISSEGLMHVMLECKDDTSSQACFLLGDIIYSGDIEGVEGADLVAPRGAQFLVISKLVAVRGDLKQFPSRVMGDISEIDLDGSKLSGFLGGGGVQKQNRVDVGDDDKLSAFLQQSSGRVDVILDPSHSNMWYPYWEGARKMAPQFRSKGIGYIRLGDDMSRFGTAFISLDAGQTYLDKGATSIVAAASTPTAAIPLYAPISSTPKSPSSSSSTPSYRNHDSIPSPGRIKSGSANRGFAIGDVDKPGNSTHGHTTAITSVVSAIAGNGDEITSAASVASRVAALSRISTNNRSGSGSGRPTITMNGSFSSASSVVTSRTSSYRKPSLYNIEFKEFDEIKATVNALKDTEPNWAGRVELLRRLYNAICNATSLLDTSADINATATAAAAAAGSRSDTMSVSSMASCAAFEFPPSLITEVVGVLINCITRQKNPHVLRAAVCCVRVIAPHAAVHTPVGIAWRTLLLETIHLLRVSSKPVFEEARDALMHIHGTAIALAHLFPLIDEILVGPNGKPAGASNTSKVIQWIDSIVKSEAAATVAVMNGTGKMAFDRVDCGTLFVKIRPLLMHREETTRDISVELCGSLLAHDILCGPVGGFTGFCSVVANVTAAANLTEAPTSPKAVAADNSTSPGISGGIEAVISPRKLVNSTPFSKSFRAMEFIGPDATSDTSGALLSTLKKHGSVSASKRALSQYNAATAGAAGGAGGHLLAALSAPFVKALSELEGTGLRTYEKVMLSATQVLVALQEAEEDKMLSHPEEDEVKMSPREINYPVVASFPDITDGEEAAAAEEAVGTPESGAAVDHVGADLYGIYGDNNGVVPAGEHIAVSDSVQRTSYSIVPDTPASRITSDDASAAATDGDEGDDGGRRTSFSIVPDTHITPSPVASALKRPSLVGDDDSIRTPGKSVRIALESEGEGEKEIEGDADADADADADPSDVEAAQSDAAAPLLDTVVHSEEIVTEAMSHLSLTGDKVKELLDRLKKGGEEEAHLSPPEAEENDNSSSSSAVATDVIVNEAMNHLSETEDKVKDLLERLKKEGVNNSRDEVVDHTSTLSIDATAPSSLSGTDGKDTATITITEEVKNLTVTVSTAPETPLPAVPDQNILPSPPPAPLPLALPRTPDRANSKKSETSTPAASAPTTPNSKIGASAGGTGTGTAPSTPQSRSRRRTAANNDVGSLSSQWFEARLILRIIPNTDAGWTQFAMVVQGSSQFFAYLDNVSAKSRMTKGALIRVLLPFDEDTSSSDQSQIRKGSKLGSTSVAVDPDLVNAVKDVDPSLLMNLRTQAVGIRRMIRIKMADEADLKQAIQATVMLRKFCMDVENVALGLDISPAQVVVELEEEGTPKKKAAFCGGLFMRKKK